MLCSFAMLILSCETDFDVNSEWKETTVVYGLLDASADTQFVKIGKAFLGEMDAFQMAQYADSINYDTNVLDVMIYKWGISEIVDSIKLVPVPTVRVDAESIDGIFNDSIIIYTFINENSFLQINYNYELVIRNKISENLVTSSTSIIDGLTFEMPLNFKLGFVVPTSSSNNSFEFSTSTVEWDNPMNSNGSIFQLDLIFNYIENGSPLSITFSQDQVDSSEDKITIEGESFFTFLRSSIDINPSKVRSFSSIDLVMTVGSEDLETYINVNKPANGVVQERPSFTNINNGVGLFSSRFTKARFDIELTQSSLNYLKSVDGLDLNFQ